MKEKLAPFLEYFAESTTACLVTMVQGNMLAIGASHLIIASQTGVAAGAISYVSILLARTGKRWAISLILGAVTGGVDFVVHPGMFGTVVTEAIITGIGAAVLSYLLGIAVRYSRARRSTASGQERTD